MQNLSAFIAKHRVRLDSELTDSNPNMDDMPEGSAHWRCVLKVGRRRLTVPFSQGPAIVREPTAADLLDCLASDAAGVENASGDFEDWASEYGYDTDSRRAERIFQATVRQTEGLRRLLGDIAYNELLWHTERE